MSRAPASPKIANHCSQSLAGTESNLRWKHSLCSCLFFKIPRGGRGRADPIHNPCSCACLFRLLSTACHRGTPSQSDPQQQQSLGHQPISVFCDVPLWLLPATRDWPVTTSGTSSPSLVPLSVVTTISCGEMSSLSEHFQPPPSRSWSKCICDKHHSIRSGLSSPWFLLARFLPPRTEMQTLVTK